LNLIMKVPPMPAQKVEKLLKRELGVDNLSEIFSEIDLDSPLGSASIAQVRKKCERQMEGVR